MYLKEGLSNTSKTLVETAALYIASRTAGKILDKFKIPHGNVCIRKDNFLSKIWHNDPYKRRVIGLVVAPITEEIGSRVVPILATSTADKTLGYHDRKLSVIVDVAKALSFALAHNYWEDENGQKHFEYSLPLEQLAYAAYATWLGRRRGIQYMFLAHSGFNMLAETEKHLFPSRNHRV